MSLSRADWIKLISAAARSPLRGPAIQARFDTGGDFVASSVSSLAFNYLSLT
jgi:hypothetical protein